MYATRTYSLEHVLANPTLFNTNNHGAAPDDYREVVDRNDTGNWIDRFHADYSTIRLDSTDVAWMREALQVGAVTRRFSHLFDDELELTRAKYQPQMDAVNARLPPGDAGWFVRSDRVSLKEGEYGVGPYHSLEHVLKSMVSTTLGHAAIGRGACTLYFLPWVEMDRDREFRVFVHRNRVTAVSAQHLYSVNRWLGGASEADVARVVDRMMRHFDEVVRDKLLHLGDYSFDVVLIDETPYFIEPNSFGAAYAAGSALFHWIRDDDVLHGRAPLELRYVDRE